jgi:hypothetical protein
LLRFLRARKFDWEKTKLMFDNFIKWRVDNDVDNVLLVRINEILMIFFSRSILKKHQMFKGITLTDIIKLTKKADQSILREMAS